MKHEDSEEMLSGVTLFEVDSHSHTMKEAKRVEMKVEEVEEEGRGERES